MTIANVLSVTFAILGAIVAFTSFWLLVSVLAPGPVDRARERLARTPLKSFFTGLPLAFVLLVGGVGLLQGGAPAKLAGALMFGAGVLLSTVGLAALSRLIGLRLPSPVDRERPWRSLVRGALCLQFSWVLPFIGWFGISGLSIVTGLGAAVLGWIRPLAPEDSERTGSAADDGPVDEVPEEQRSLAGATV
ncbi:MAG: hypothetical protein ACYTG4_06865 [Planctomycetota bacterium]|jgi:hypothetical protein